MVSVLAPLRAQCFERYFLFLVVLAVVTATYAYSPFDELVSVVDPQNNQTTVDYYQRGFRIHTDKAGWIVRDAKYDIGSDAIGRSIRSYREKSIQNTLLELDIIEGKIKLIDKRLEKCAAQATMAFEMQGCYDEAALYAAKLKCYDSVRFDEDRVPLIYMRREAQIRLANLRGY